MMEYEKFKEIYDEIDELIALRVSASTPKFQAWRVKAERFLLKKYGEKSYEVKNFKSFPFSLMCYTFDTSENDFIKACKDDLCSVKAIFEQYLVDMQEENVVLISDGNIELPSDLQGVVYSNKNEWKFQVLKELKAIGYYIDYNKIDE